MVPPTVERDVGLWFHLDTNRINSRGRLPNVNQLEEWDRNGVIHVSLSEPSMREAEQGRDPIRRRKAYSYTAWATFWDTEHEQAQARAIEAILFPGGARTPNQGNDVEIVFTTLKYPAILVTNDGASKSQPGGILGRREELQAWDNRIRIMTDDEAVHAVADRIRKRDERAQTYNAMFGHPLPDWVGMDDPSL